MKLYSGAYMFEFFGKKKKDMDELKRAVVGEDSPAAHFIETKEEHEPEPIFIEPKEEKPSEPLEEAKKEPEIRKPLKEPSEPQPEHPQKEEAKLEEAKPAVKPVEKKEEKSTAPLFIKVDKYKDMVANLEEIRVLLRGMKQIFSMFSEIERIRDDSLKILRATLQRIERNIIAIDSYMLKPPELKLETEEPEKSKIEESLMDLHKQLKAIKEELEKVRK